MNAETDATSSYFSPEDDPNGKLKEYVEGEGLPEDQKKGTLKLVGIIAAMGMFFAGFNLNIYFDAVLLNPYLKSFLPDQAATSTFLNIVSIKTIVFMIALVVGGAVSDDLRTKFGNRLPMILGGSIIAGIGYFIGPFVIMGDSASALITGAIIYSIIGIGWGISLAPEYSLISELFTKNERGWAGLGLAGFGLIGTVIGLLMETVFDISPSGNDWTNIWIFVGIVVILLGLITFLTTPRINPPFPPDGIIQDLINTPKYLFSLGDSGSKDFLLFLVIGALWGGAGFIISSILPNFIAQLRSDGFVVNLTSSSILLFLGISGAVFAAPVGFLIVKIGKVKSAMLGSITLGIFSFLLAQRLFWGDFRIISLALVGGFGIIIITTVNVSLPADLVPRGKEGQFMGVFAVAANILAPPLGIMASIIINDSVDVLTGYSTVFLIITLLYFLAIGLLTFMQYERQLESEYQLFYRRYLIFKGYLSSKSKKAAFKVSSSLDKASSKIRR